MQSVLKFGCILVLLLASLEAVAQWPCEGLCSDSYTRVYATSPASGSSYDTGNVVRFTTNVERYTNSTYIPFTTMVSTSGGSGWSTSIISPSEYCLYGPFSSSLCSLNYPALSRAENVDVVIDVTIGTGDTTVTVTLDNQLGGGFVSPEFTFDVSANDGVRVTALSDMNDTWNGSGDANGNDDICVFRSAAASYDVSVSGLTDAGNYVLEDGGSNDVIVALYWNDETGTTGRVTLDPADSPSIASATGANTSSDTCSGGTSANLSWNVLESNMDALPAGTYSATITVTIEVP
ncbi:MAG: hypothetical protein K6L76_08735 [Agarilytica sp.]